MKLLRKLPNTTRLALRDIGRKLGLEVRLNGINARDDLRLVHFLNLHSIDLVLDVGANTGQFGKNLFAGGYKGSLISFEALPTAYGELVKTASTSGADWIVAPQVALSSEKGMATFHVTGASTSSSLLAPLDSFIASAPQVYVDETIQVLTERLDAFIPLMRLEKNRTFLKLDVQGAEASVLAGAPNVLERVHGVLTELSLMPLYEDQSSPFDIHSVLDINGLEVWDIWQGYRDARTSRLTQIDAVYFRR